MSYPCVGERRTSKSALPVDFPLLLLRRRWRTSLEKYGPRRDISASTEQTQAKRRCESRTGAEIYERREGGKEGRKNDNKKMIRRGVETGHKGDKTDREKETDGRSPLGPHPKLAVLNEPAIARRVPPQSNHFLPLPQPPRLPIPPVLLLFLLPPVLPLPLPHSRSLIRRNRTRIKRNSKPPP